MTPSNSNERRKCCICGETFVGFGSNPEPVKKGRCCRKCDEEIVIPCRYGRLMMGMHPYGYAEIHKGEVR